jgi:L-phenylalanine/L-methionine N-acetyltransferase
MLSTKDVGSNAVEHGVLIRRREKRDAAALVRMFNQPRCALGMVLDPFQSTGELEAWLQSSGTQNFEAVASVDDTAIGLAGLFPCRDTQSHAGWIILFVHDDFHGCGIGNLLMTVLVTSAHILGLSRMQLMVVDDNDRAIALYRKFGFDVEGRHEHYARRGDEFLTTLSMARITPKGSPRYQHMEDFCGALRERAALEAAAGRSSISADAMQPGAWM